MQKAATAAGVNVVYVHVDHATPDTVRRAVEGCLVITDTPRAEDQAAVEKAAGGLLRERSVPTMNVMTMSPPCGLATASASVPNRPRRCSAITLNERHVGKLRQDVPHITRGILKSERGEILPPIELPDQGIWHPRSEEVFPHRRLSRGPRTSRDRGEWRPQAADHRCRDFQFHADGQTRMMEDPRVSRAGACR